MRQVAGLVAQELLAQIAEAVVVGRQLQILGTGLPVETLPERQLAVGDELDLSVVERKRTKVGIKLKIG